MALLEELTGQVLDEKYRIEKQLGQGGMGAVFLATHLGTERPVALKVIAPQFMANLEFVERFKREAKAAGRLRHPNVVNVTDFGFARAGSEQLAYLVMEYLDGCTLGDMLDKKERLPFGIVVDIVEQVCLAIDEAHRQGILHRDLKPDNIWLEPTGRGGYNVKVLDFGLAKLRDAAPTALTSDSHSPSLYASNPLPSPRTETETTSAITMALSDANLEIPTKIQPAKVVDKVADEVETRVLEERKMAGAHDTRVAAGGLTRVGAVLGTPLYMSPEQCCGEALDARSDIYSLGVITYEMLAGQTPFTGNMETLIAQHIEAPPPPLNQKQHDIPKPVAALVMSALAKKAAERPATAAAFATALRANAEGTRPLLRKALALYSEHLPTFARISMFAQVPFIVFNLLLWFGVTLIQSKTTPSLLFHILHKGHWLVWLMSSLFANAVNAAACALIVEQLRVAPSRSIELQTVFATLTKRLGALATTAMQGYLNVFLQLFKLIVPGLRTQIDNSLYAPIVVLEDKERGAALERSKALVDRLRSAATLIQIRDLSVALMPLLIFPLAFVLCGMLFDLLKPAGVSRETILLIFAAIPTALIVLLHPPIAIALAMLYFKTRQAGGEKLNEELGLEFVEGEKLEGSTIPYTFSVYLLVGLLMALTIWVAVQKPALGFAVRNGYTDIVGVLLDVGADVNGKVEDEIYNEMAPLILAAERGHTDTVRLLLDKGADINRKTYGGWTALISAAGFGRTGSVKLLLDRGADINERTNYGWTALTWAASCGHTDTVELLLDRGADINTKIYDGLTALVWAAGFGRTDTVKLLLDRGADINAKTDNGSTALIQAISGGHIDTVKLLLDRGADVNANDKSGRTALMHAVADNLQINIKRPEIIKTLLEKGADINAKDRAGKTALMLAVEAGRKEIVQLLKDAGAAE